MFIQGGGFNSNANPNLNGSGLIEASGHNIIVVTFNYRVGPWGFLASSTSGSGKSTANNGLLDQRKALEWVQKHISAFGGDPKHVVIGGDSAGAASISLHLTAYGGRNDNLFQAAAAESVSFATVLTNAESQYQYENLAHAVGCHESEEARSLACLRSKSAAEIQHKNMNIPFPGKSKPPLYMFDPTLDGAFITDLTYTAFQQGKFIDVPVIFGDDTNGGTIFTPRNTSSQEESNDFLETQFPYLTSSQLDEIAELFPVPTHHCPESGCWWRQVSNAYGEMRYMCPSLYISSAYANLSSSTQSSHYKSKDLIKIARAVTDYIGGGTLRRSPWIPLRKTQTDHNLIIPKSVAASTSGKSWAYRYNVEDPDQVADGLGVPHTVEINAIFGPYNVPPTPPASYFPGKKNANIVPVIQAYWTSFIRTFDPNTYKLDGSAQWDQYYSKDHEPQRMLFGTGGKTEMEAVDRGQRERCAYLQGIGPSVRQKRDNLGA